MGEASANKLIGFSSIAIDFLRRKSSEVSNICFAFVYFSHTRTITPVEIMGSLLKHLVYRNGSLSLSKELRDLYSEHMRNSTRPTFTEFAKVLEAESREIPSLFVVFDALDECAQQDDTRTKILNELRRLPTVRLLITGRADVAGVMSILGDVSELEICARDEDIDKYIEGEVDRKENLINNCKNDEDLKKTIREIIVMKARGM